MEEIKVGEYVRTKSKGIKKIDTIFENRTVNRYGYEIGSEWDGKLYSTIKTTDIIKHSPNIIDLIEVGDYVNEHLVVELSENVYGQRVAITEVDGKDGAIRHHYLERSIKSIVTKEQFQSVMYEV